MNGQIEIDLGLARVSDGALLMLERAGGLSSLPARLFSGLLDAVAQEHLRRYGAAVGTTTAFRMQVRAVDPDELWHALRLLGNWLSYAHDSSGGDPDTEAVGEVAARMWIGMRGAFKLIMEGFAEDGLGEVGN